MLTLEYKYDVALSFSGKDRDIARSLANALQARNITVFYDEWAKAELWGKDLIENLHNVYSANAKFCVPILSKHYTKSKWTKHEIKSAKERSLDSPVEYILPIRLDNTTVPELAKSIAYVDYYKSNDDEIAGLIVEKLKKITGSTVVKVINDVKSIQLPNKIDGFQRKVVDYDIRIDDNDFIGELYTIWPSSNGRLRYNFAKNLGRFLSFKFHMRFGPVYSAWRVDNKVMLSTLPEVTYSSDGHQRTYEFEIYGSKAEKLALVAEWIPLKDSWGPFAPAEFQSTVKGICADRSGCDMTRESTIYCLEKRGATFQFPVSCDETPDKFCGWLEGEVETVLFDWDRNPRLIQPAIGIWDSLYHEETGEGILLFVVHGSWSNSALYTLEDVLDIYLPKRYKRTPLLNGSMRICVHLSNTPPVFTDSESIERYDFDDKDVWQSIKRVYVAIARMVAAQREIPIDTPNPSFGLKELNSFHSFLFSEAVNSLKGLEHPEKVKDRPDYNDINYTSPWSVLRHSPYTFRINVESSIESFDFSNVVTKKDLVNYIKYHENRIS